MKDNKFSSIQSNKVLIFVEVLLNYLPVALTFLMPVFFLTTFTEFYEYSKFVLFLVGTILLTVLWILKLLLSSKVYITKSDLDTPIWMYLAAFTLSTFTSIKQTDSIFGTQTSWVPSLIALVTFILYFYVISTNLRSLQAIKYSIYGLMFGGTISSLVLSLTYFGVKFGSQPFLQIPTFNLAGSIEIAALVASIALLFGVSVFFNTKDSLIKSLSFLSFFINFVALTIVWHYPSLILAGAGFVYVCLTFVRNFKTIKVEFTTVAAVAAIWIILISLPLTAKYIKKNTFALEPALDVQTSWYMAANVLKDRPIWGMGPNTFAKVYNQNKTLSINNSPNWNYNFSRPISQVFDDLASLGILGSLISLYFMFRLFELVKNIFEKKEEFSPVHQALLIPVIGIPFYHLMANSSTQSTFMFYTYLGIFISLVAGFGKNKKSEDIYISIKSFSTVEVSDQPEKKEKFQYFAVLPLIGAASAIAYYSTFNVQGEYFFRKAIDSALSNDVYGVYNNQINARNAFPRRDEYDTAIAQTNLNLAVTLANKGNLTPEEKSAIQTLISEAIRSTRIATETLDPLNLNNWLVRASIYKTLIGVTSDADQWAISALGNAAQLDPVNPNIRMDMGTIYFAKGDFLSAANMFKQATQLKQNFANAHYNLAQALIKLEAYDVAANELEITKSLLPASSQDIERLNKELNEVKSKTKVAGANTKASVQQIENKDGQNSDKAATLTKPDVSKNNNNLDKAVNDSNVKNQ